MPSARTLLDRLEHPDERGAPDRSGDMSQVMASIREHLEVMLNARHGASQTVPDFGTSAFSEIGIGTEAMERMRQDIEHSIRAYEPRLRNARAEFVERATDTFILRLDIVADVVIAGRARRTTFPGTIEASGEVKVNPRADR